MQSWTQHIMGDLSEPSHFRPFLIRAIGLQRSNWSKQNSQLF